MYLLILTLLDNLPLFVLHLHPTMYLLILSIADLILLFFANLHPTMYLLILIGVSIVDITLTFTSHYVSINSIICTINPSI